MTQNGLFKYLVLSALIIGIGVAVLWRSGSDQTQATPKEIVVPTLTAAAQLGEIAFNENCASCHGKNGAGTEQGPPLIHDIYNPGHHSDAAFRLAVKRGVPPHHWPFGAMPSQPQVSRGEVEAIITYVRELQAANGIRYRRHQM